MILRSPSVRLVIMAMMAMPLLLGCALERATPLYEDDEFEFRKKEAAEINAQLALQYLSINQLQIAKEKVDKAMLENPKSPQVLNAAALLEIQLTNNKQAEKHFKKALSIEPENPDILNNYGAFLLRQYGDHQKAFEKFSQANKNPLYRSREISSTNLANALYYKYQSKQQPIPKEDSLRILGFIEQSISFNQKYAPAYLSYAEMLYYQEQYDEAKKYLLTYHTIQTPSPISLMLGINIATKANNVVEKNNYEKMLLTQFPNSAETRSYIKRQKNNKR